MRLSFYSLRVGQTDPNMLLFLSDSSHHQVSDDMTDQIMVHMINQFDQQLQDSYLLLVAPLPFLLLLFKCFLYFNTHIMAGTDLQL